MGDKLSKIQVLKLINKWLNNSHLNNNLAILDILNELGISGMKLNSKFIKEVLDNDLDKAKETLATEGMGK